MVTRRHRDDHGPDGAYRVAFTYGGPKAKPDLQARAFSGETLLGVSEVRYDAASDEILDVPVSDDAQAALATEHEALTGDIAAHYAGSLRDLQETGDRQDVTYLANKTGWDARAVALASLADQFSAGTADPAGAPAIHPALFYALFRAGLPANDAAIYRTDAASVGAIWQQGIDQGIVPAHLADTLPGVLEQFRALSARQAVSGPAIAGRSPLAEMLAVSLPEADATQHEQFARLQIQHQGDPAGFWDAVQAAFGEPSARRLKLDGQLGYLTLNNAPLIARLHDAAGETPLADPVELLEARLPSARAVAAADRRRAARDPRCRRPGQTGQLRRRSGDPATPQLPHRRRRRHGQERRDADRGRSSGPGS